MLNHAARLVSRRYESPGFCGEGGLVNPSRDNFAQNLRRLMAAKNIRNADVAREFDVSRSTVGHWVDGSTQPGFEDLDHLATFFGVPVASLFEDPTDSRTTGLDIDKAIRMVTEAAKKGSSQ